MDLSMLNPQQRLAAETLEGPVLILAGAGSGKTRALTCRAANLMAHGVAPWHILCLTFTNKAAREMKNRITALVGEQAEEAWISTFHSSCARILRRDIEKLGYSRSFVIFDTDDQERVIKEQLKRLNIDEKFLPVKELLQRISGAKNRLLDADGWFQESPRDRRSQQIHDVFLAYENRLHDLNALDFDDLLLKTLQLLLEHPPVLEYYQTRFQYVMVDEYQDTNHAQYELVRLITRNHRNLCVVGDDDQSIYGWRGADIRNILDFEKDFPETVVIKLEENYRSTATILDAANQVIAHNADRKDKRLWTEEGDGEPISVYCATDEKTEAAWVVTKLINLHRKAPWSDMAVLYRSNNQSRVLEERMTQNQVPYRVYGGSKFYERREIKDIISYLRVLVNPTDDLSLARIINVPKRAIGDSTIQELQRHASAQDMPLYAALTDMPETLASRPRKCVSDFAVIMSDLMVLKDTVPLTDFMQALMDRTGLMAQYENDASDEGRTRLENMQEFLNGVVSWAQENPEGTLEDYVESIALVTDLDHMDAERDGAVTLMTLHAAKGLEFENVFIVGMEEGVFPSGRNLQDEAKLEEERRLCYVGITRAKRRLFLSRALSRMYYSQANHNEASRFLSEIPSRLIRDESISCERAYPAASQRERPQRQHAPLRPLARPGQSLTLGGQGLNIPGVQKGFAPSRARELTPKPQFASGDRVMHRKFGEGVVTQVTAERVTISFIAYGEKSFALSLAPIVKIED